MGLLKQGILGGFRGKVGNVVGTAWKGKAVIKAMPLSVANPRTAGQVEQRGKFSKLVGLAGLILASLIKPLWDRFSSGMSGYNSFISVNRDAFDALGNIDPSKILISRGRLLPPVVVDVTRNGNKCRVDIGHAGGDKYALPTDRLYCLIASQDLSRIYHVGITEYTRANLSLDEAEFTFKSQQECNDAKQFYFTYLRYDGSEVGTSSHYNE